MTLPLISYKRIRLTYTIRIRLTYYIRIRFSYRALLISFRYPPSVVSSLIKKSWILGLRPTSFLSFSSLITYTLYVYIYLYIYVYVIRISFSYMFLSGLYFKSLLIFWVLEFLENFLENFWKIFGKFLASKFLENFSSRKFLENFSAYEIPRKFFVDCARAKIETR